MAATAHLLVRSRNNRLFIRTFSGRYASKRNCFPHESHFLAGIQEHVIKLRKISNEVFQLLVKLRRPSDPLGTRFNTVCHGDMWMGNLMYNADVSECTIIDFHSAQFLSPATDLAHLMLTSTSRKYRQEVRVPRLHEIVRGQSFSLAAAI